ncbi:MAG: hypothetical protein WCG81_03240 [Candidatus Angelobacter sp.]
MTTSWTGNALRPAESGNGINADLFIAKVLDGGLKSFWFHVDHLKPEYRKDVG